MHVIGIDLGGTKLAGALFDAEGTLQQTVVRQLEKREGREVGMLICEMISALLEVAGRQNLPVSGVGISVPGIAYIERGEVWAPNIPGWDNYPLIGELKAGLKQPGLRLLLDSDRSCYILGEQWKGAARGCRNAIYMAVGTGIGAGILADGRVLQGAGNIAGAIGWMALSRPWKAPYEYFGCHEYHASGAGLARVAKVLLDQEAEYAGPMRNLPHELTAKDVFDHFDLNDPIAVKVIEQAIVYWGMAVANLVSIFNPEKIIFGGGVFGPALRFLDEIRDEAKKWAQPISMKQVQLEASQLGGDAGLAGAGFLVLQG